MAQRRPAARAAFRPRYRILHHHAAPGRELQLFPRPIEALRIGLAGTDVLRRDDLGEMGAQAG